MTQEEDIAVIKNDIKWIKAEIGDMKTHHSSTLKLTLGLAGSIITAITAIILTIIK